MPIYKDIGHKNAEGLQRYKVRINYVTEQGRHKQLTRIAYGLQQAKQLEMLLQADKKSPTTSLTVAELYAIYYNIKKHEVREITMKRADVNFQHHILPFLGTVKLSKLSTHLLQEWKQSINEKKLSVVTKQNMFREFKTFLNWSTNNDYIAANPLNKIENFRDAYNTPIKDKIKYYTGQQFKEYIAAALAHAESTNNYNFYVFFNIAFYTGMRKGEINALKWSDIEENKIHVRRSIAQKLKGENRETPPKNKSSYRTIQAPKALLTVLEGQRLRHKAITSDIANLRVCGGECCLRDTTIDKFNRTHAANAALPRITIHEFRHPYVKL